MNQNPKFQVAMPRVAHDRLKALAAANKCRPGVMIQALVALAADISAEQVQAAVDRAKAANSGWVVDRVAELTEHFTRLRDLARQAGDESTARQAEAEVQRLKAEYGG